MKIEHLDVTAREEAVKVLADAFRGYPVMRFVIGDGQGYDVKLRALVGFYSDRRFSRGWPVLGLRGTGDRLLAVALVNPPHRGDESTGPGVSRTDLRATLGPAAFERMCRFEEVSDANEVGEPHHFLGMLGVLPAHQREGYGGALLREVCALSEGGESRGVCLTTEDPANLPFYRRHGFDVIAEADVDELHTWCLFRATGE